jgi:glycolate oxidase
VRTRSTAASSSSPAGDEAAAEAAGRAFEEIVELALSLGGTIAGEHGVGPLKREFIPRATGSAELLHRAVKQALDPQGILNPGKAI